jgi:hypothetical protein
MNCHCEDLEFVLRRQDPELLEALTDHAQSCPTCHEELKRWNEISSAAVSLKKQWESPALWPTIAQALAAEAHTRNGRISPASAIGVERARRLRMFLWDNWQPVAAALLLSAVSLSSAWMLLRNPSAPEIQLAVPRENQLLTGQTVRQIERAETAYLQSINKLSKLVEPRIEQPSSPLLASYREKLMMIDAAIDECRAGVEQNRFNAHLRLELLSIYREKQHTLQQVAQEQ